MVVAPWQQTTSGGSVGGMREFTTGSATDRQPSDDRDLVAANFLSGRKRKGLSQAALAQAMQEAGVKNWHQNTVSRIEKGQRAIYFEEMQALDGLLETNLLRGTELGERVRQGASKMADALTVRHLRQAHEALIEAERVIRGLRSVYDDDFDGGE